MYVRCISFSLSISWVGKSDKVIKNKTLTISTTVLEKVAFYFSVSKYAAIDFKYITYSNSFSVIFVFSSCLSLSISWVGKSDKVIKNKCSFLIINKKLIMCTTSYCT